MKILKLLIISVGLVLFSCSNEEFQIEEPRSELEVRTSGQSSLSFSYNGKVYSSDYILEKDSSCVFVNKEVEELLVKFTQDSAVSVLVKEDGNLEYFDNITLLNQYLEKEMSNRKATKALPVEAFLSIWNDPNGQGYWMGFEARYSLPGPVLPEFKGNDGNCQSVGKKMNDKISSFDLYGGRVTFYEHDDFGGQNITFSGGDQYHLYIGDLRNVPRPYQRGYDYLGRPLIVYGNWNDIISSFRVYKTLR